MLSKMDKGKETVRKLADAMHLLADHQYRLSLTRRAFIKLSLSLLEKNTSDTIKIDEWLFGSEFAEDLKAVQACEKVARDLSETSQFPSKAIQQPIRRHPT